MSSNTLNTSGRTNHNIENIKPTGSSSCCAVLVPEHSTVKENCILSKYNLRTKSIQNRLDIETRRNQSKSKLKMKSKNRGAPLSKHRRKTANARERSRMQSVNAAFATLKQIVPTNLTDEITDKKLTKITTLRLAVNYIAALTKMLEDTSSTNNSSSEVASVSPSCHAVTSLSPAITLNDSSFKPAHQLRNQINSTVTKHQQVQQVTQVLPQTSTNRHTIQRHSVRSTGTATSSPYFASGTSPVVQIVSSNAIACTYKMRLQPPPPPMSAAERAQQLRNNGTFSVQRKRPQLQMHPYTVKKSARSVASIPTQHIFHTMYPNLSAYQQATEVAATVQRPRTQPQISQQFSETAQTQSPSNVAGYSTNNLTNQFISNQLQEPRSFQSSYSHVPSMNNSSLQSAMITPIDDFNQLNYAELDSWLNLDSPSNGDSLDSLLDSCNSTTSSQQCQSNSGDSEFGDYSPTTLFTHDVLADLQ